MEPRTPYKKHFAQPGELLKWKTLYLFLGTNIFRTTIKNLWLSRLPTSPAAKIVIMTLVYP